MQGCLGSEEMDRHLNSDGGRIAGCGRQGEVEQQVNSKDWLDARSKPKSTNRSVGQARWVKCVKRNGERRGK